MQNGLTLQQAKECFILFNTINDMVLSFGLAKNGTTSSWVIKNASDEVFKLLLENGTDPEATSSNGYTLLLQAISLGSINKANLLLDNETINIHSETGDGYTALMLALTNLELAKRSQV